MYQKQPTYRQFYYRFVQSSLYFGYNEAEYHSLVYYVLPEKLCISLFQQPYLLMVNTNSDPS